MSLATPLEQFLLRAQQHPQQPYLHQPIDGEWKTYSWADTEKVARKIAAGLQAQGLKQGDRIAILSNNCAEWIISDIAIAMAGMISIPIYATAGADTIHYVLKHSESKLLLVGALKDYDALQAVETNIKIVAFPHAKCQADEQWNDWLEQHVEINQVATTALDDLYSIVYTSGSTGNPKGVMLTCENFAVAACDAKYLYPNGSNRILSYLPMAHITERSLVTMLSFYAPMEIFFNTSLETFLNDLKYAKPTVFITVPRVWSKIQAQIIAKIPDQRLQFLLRIPVLSSIIKAKVRKQLGFSYCNFFGSGTAPISPGVLSWYGKLGIDIIEAWGMTETSGASCANSPFKKEHLGTIGRPTASIELKSGENDELLIRGKAIFKEYYKNLEATESSFEGDWFKTGDRAVPVNDGAWKIIGRVKEQFKTGKGKYVAPVPIESLLSENTLIEQSCVLGAGKRQPVALIVVSDGTTASREDITTNLENTRLNVNEQLESHEHLSNIYIVKEPFSIENDLLTPTLKLKRTEIAKHFNTLIEQNTTDGVVWETSSQ